MRGATLLWCLGLAWQEAELPWLDPDEVVAGETVDGDRVVTTPTLTKRRRKAGVVGKRFQVELDAAGPWTIELRSLLFDPYLVVRENSSDGAIVAEDDDGLAGLQSRVVLEVPEEGGRFVVDACALHGERGPFTLRLVRGRPTPCTAAEKSRLDLEDALATVDALRRRDGDGAPSLAQPLHRAAMVLYETGRYEEAQRLFEQVLAIDEKALGQEDVQVASDLMILCEVLQVQARFACALPMAQRAFAIREKHFGENDRLVASSLVMVGSLLRHLGRFAEARRVSERALAIGEKTLGPHDLDTATCLSLLAAVAEEQGSYAEARRLFERALAIHEEALGPDHPDTATARSNLAGLLMSQGRYADALPMYRRALASLEVSLGPEALQTAIVLNNLASLLEMCGDSPESRTLYARALAIWERALGPDHPTVALGLRNLAEVLRSQGNDVEAQLLYARSLAILEKALAPDHPEIAQSLIDLAGVLREQQRLAQARPLYERALVIREKALGPDHPATAMSLHSLALLADDEGKPALARQLEERAVAILEKSLGAEHPRLASRLDLLASLAWNEGDYPQARHLYERALAIDEKALGPDNPGLARRCNNLAFVLADLGEREEALALVQRAVAVSEAELDRSLGLLSEWERVQWSAQAYRLVQNLVSFAALDPRPEVRRATYDTVLRWKGNVHRAGLQSRERLRTSLDAATGRCVEDLRAVQSQLSTAVRATPASGLDAGAHERMLTSLRQRRGELERELQRSPASGATSRSAGLADVGRALPAGSVLVDLLVRDWHEPAKVVGGRRVAPIKYMPAVVTAWIVGAGATDVTRIELGDAGRLAAATRRFLDRLVDPRADRRDFAAAGAELRALLWDPLADAIGAADIVFVSPDRFLGTLPFEALLLADGRFLVEEKRCVYLPDAVALVDLAQRPHGPAAGGLLALGHVDYDALAASAAPSRLLRDGASDRLRGGLGRWESLPFTAAEAAIVGETWTASTAGAAAAPADGAIHLADAAATEEALKALLPGKRWLHLATHGFCEPDQVDAAWDAVRSASEPAGPIRSERTTVRGLMPGLLSGLVCAGANLKPTGGRDDGLLTADEITWLDLSACELAVLSACKTALGTERAGQGMASLQSAFRMAGAKTVVASLWNVGDASTAELMESFYENLWLHHLPRIDALRNAQLEMLARNRSEPGGDPRPRTWAAFVLSGEWR